MDIVDQLGELALATRLKRLSERLMKDVSQIYGDLEEDFQARWFTLLYALANGAERRQDRATTRRSLRPSPRAITDLAQALGLSHPAINQIAAQVIRRGLVKQARDPRDERRRLLLLTPRGRNLVKRLEPVWEEIRQANADLLAEAGVDLLGDLERIEIALDASSMAERIRERLNLPLSNRLQIVDYRPAYKKHFASLNRQWLEKYFTVEKSDARLLADPNGRIIKRDGAILFALLDGEVVGTAALIRHGEDAWELAKMAVTRTARGRGIGYALARAVIDRAREQDARYLYLQTSPQLAAACRLYRRLGFRRVKRHPLTGDAYSRCTIAMRLDISRYDSPPQRKESR